MTFTDLVAYKHLTLYKISKETNLPLSTLHDISSGKSELLLCNGKTLRDLSLFLGVTIEELLLLEKEESKCGLPDYLYNSIIEFRKALRNNSSLIDCYSDELGSNINVAEIEQQISHETASRLRNRYVYDRLF